MDVGGPDQGKGRRINPNASCPAKNKKQKIPKKKGLRGLCAGCDEVTLPQDRLSIPALRLLWGVTNLWQRLLHRPPGLEGSEKPDKSS